MDWRTLRAEYIASMKDRLSPEAFKDLQIRQTGRSLGIAFKKIGEALSSPDEWINVKDHFESRDADQHLLYTIQDLLHKNGLEGFYFNKTKCLIKYSYKPDPHRDQAAEE